MINRRVLVLALLGFAACAGGPLPPTPEVPEVRTGEVGDTSQRAPGDCLQACDPIPPEKQPCVDELQCRVDTCADAFTYVCLTG